MDAMPELPEVETIRRDLEPHVVGRRIVRTWCSDGPRYGDIHDAAGRAILALRRRGKYLLAELGEVGTVASPDAVSGIAARELVIHLGMSGRLFTAASRPDSPHLRAVIELDGPEHLYFDDMRKFGQLLVVRPGEYEALETLAHMGPEPLSADFDAENFHRALVASRAPVKAVLLGQRVVAGIGNIYADEALFLAGIHPGSRSVSRPQSRRLHAALKQVLAEAIANRGTSFSLYRDGHLREGNHYRELKVYDREDQPCPRCHTAICKTRIAGRGTHFCPSCQKPPRSTGNGRG